MNLLPRITILLALFGAGLQAQTQSRVGTFDRQSIVVAYYGSPMWRAELKAKRAEHDAAVQAGDTKKADELARWGGESQDLAHRQLAGKAPITNILEALQPAFAEISKSENLERITPDAESGAKVEIVDVTDRIVDWLKTDERTRQMIRDLRANRK